MWEGSVRFPCRKDVHSSLSSSGEMKDLGVELVSKQTPHNAVRRKMCGSLEERGGHSARGVLDITGFYLAGFPQEISVNHATNFLLPEACPVSLCYVEQAWANPGEQGIGVLSHHPCRPCRPCLPKTLPRPECTMRMLAPCSERVRAGRGPASLAGRETLQEAGAKFRLQK